MDVLVCISTEAEPLLYHININKVIDTDLKKAIEFCIKNPNANSKFGNYDVIGGIILQVGYQMNEELFNINTIKQLGIPVVSVRTEI